jgi:hypothetical protein
VIASEGRGSKHILRRSASDRRHVRLQTDDYACPKSLAWDRPVTEVLSLAHIGFALSRSQVSTLEAILNEAEKRGMRISLVAYCMATADDGVDPR